MSKSSNNFKVQYLNLYFRKFESFKKDFKVFLNIWTFFENNFKNSSLVLIIRYGK